MVIVCNSQSPKNNFNTKLLHNITFDMIQVLVGKKKREEVSELELSPLREPQEYS